MKKINVLDFIEEANLIHNQKYDYSLVNYKSSKEKVKIICHEHGEFEQSPYHHTKRKHGCPNCSKNRKISKLEIIEKAKLIHGEKFDYSLVNFINYKTKIKIMCPEHGLFEQTIGSHIDQKTGCSKCSKKYSYNNLEFIEKAKIIHGTKFDYSLVEYVNSYSKIKILCPEHGVFEQTPSNHLSGKGCEICNISKSEIIISNYLIKNNINFIQQHKFINCKFKRALPFDFYLPDLNICIEFNGKQHYEPIKFFGGEYGFKKQIIRDKIKIEYCRDNNIQLNIFKYNDNLINKLNLLFIDFIKSITISG